VNAIRSQQPDRLRTELSRRFAGLLHRLGPAELEQLEHHLSDLEQRLIAPEGAFLPNRGETQ